MRTPIYLLFVFLSSASVLLRAAGPAPAPLSEAIKIAQAAAYVRVIHVSEELGENLVKHTATFAICGRATGLDNQPQIEIAWELPVTPKPTTELPYSKFSTGDRWIILLTNRNDRWEIVRSLPLSSEGKIADGAPGAEIGIQPGIEADDAVQLIAAHLEKKERRSTQRTAPPAVSGRNQPWKLMRTSPLRRVWPFFPH